MVDVSRMPFLFQARQTDGICKPGRVSVSVAARRQYVGAGGLWRHEKPARRAIIGGNSGTNLSRLHICSPLYLFLNRSLH